jgi:anaerobic ribonucleoside-triphosphate reductase
MKNKYSCSICGEKIRFFDSQWFFCINCDEWIDYEFLKKDIENE